ncbi:MAG: lytic transglycosylase domain-containing protein [Deltaproteobacteria bacterium]
MSKKRIIAAVLILAIDCFSISCYAFSQHNIKKLSKSVAIRDDKVLSLQASNQQTFSKRNIYKKMPSRGNTGEIPEKTFLWLEITPIHDAIIDIEIRKCAQEFNVDEALIAALVMQESKFNPHAHFGRGYGLMQLEPPCCKAMDVPYPCTDIHQNLWAGTGYLKKQLDSFGDNPKIALAAYNFGPTAVGKLVKNYGSNYENIERSLPYTTQQHVKEVMEYYSAYKNN